MPVEFLSDEHAATYGRFTAPPSRAELERFFFLDDTDKTLIAIRRSDHSKLGFSLQLVTVRYLGTFLTDPLDVPTGVLDYVAEQLGMADASQAKAYVEREKTRFEHQWEIIREYRWQDFTPVQAELTRWIDDRAWTTGDGLKAIFDGAVGWLRERQVLLPGVTTLARLVARVRDAALQRLWDTLSALLTPAQARLLEELLDVADGARVSDLERLRRGPTVVSGKAMVGALDRIGEVAGLGLGGTDLTAVPARRVVELARYGMAGKAPALRRHPYSRKLATLLATVVYLEAKAIDDALELFDVLMTTNLMARAERASSKEKLRRYPRMSRDGAKCAAAVAVLLEAVEWGDDVSLDVIWDAIESRVSRAELRAAVANLAEVAPPPDAEPHGEWRAALVERYPVVRQFLPKLCTIVEFGATAEAAAVLYAVNDLPELLTARPTKKVPTGFLDARRVAVDLVPAGWWRQLVFIPGRPEGTVDRNAYVFCVLEQFHQRLRRRDIFATASTRWADPRAQLLAGEAWEVARGSVLNALQLPDEPDALLDAYAEELDAAWQHTAGRLDGGDADGEVRIDVDDLHVTIAAALTAHALNVGFTPVISGMPALTRARISHVDQNYLRSENFAAANAALIEGQADVDLAQAWGGGLVAAVDGIRFVVPVRSIHARPNPKYFGRRRGTTLLNLVNDQAVGVAGRVVSGTPRDSLHVIDLIYSQDGGKRPEVIVSDTGSYSDIVFGLLRLLGFDYRPQLADLPDTKLWRINASADYGPLDATARGRIDLARVRRHWPDILRLVASIHTGTVSAYDAMRMLQAGGSPTQLGEALAHFGRVFKTLHVLAYVDLPPYRREIKGMRNLQEGRHDLGRHVFHGRKGELYRAYHDGMEDQLGALGLVLNCITLWNTVYLDISFKQLRASGYPVLDADVARLSPYLRRHINVHGHYSFQLPELGDGRRALRDPDAGDEE
ncbi:Tn3 family transposase [Micromonosporaceae bacterium Da 78-11]